MLLRRRRLLTLVLPAGLFLTGMYLHPSYNVDPLHSFRSSASHSTSASSGGLAVASESATAGGNSGITITPHFGLASAVGIAVLTLLV